MNLRAMGVSLGNSLPQPQPFEKVPASVRAE